MVVRVPGTGDLLGGGLSITLNATSNCFKAADGRYVKNLDWCFVSKYKIKIMLKTLKLGGRRLGTFLEQSQCVDKNIQHHPYSMRIKFF